MNADDHELDFIRKQLKTAMPPWADVELESDLWPRMLRRLEETPVRFGWFEALLAALIALAFAVFPQLIPVVFYHL
jgi:hypothetical protein